MIYKYDEMGPSKFYGIMIQALIPRPIAWVLSENQNDSFNLAPFSFFTGVTSEPPIIMISVGWKDDTTRKDTWVNIEDRNDFVIHIPNMDLGETVVATSAPLKHNESELDFTKLKTVPVPGWRLPRVEGPKVAFLCKKHKILKMGDEDQGVIFGQIESIWAHDDIIGDNEGRPILKSGGIDPLARLGANEYAGLQPAFNLRRPK